MKILYLCLTGAFTDNVAYQDNMLAKFHVLQGHEVTILTTLYSFDTNGDMFKYRDYMEYISNDGYKVKRIKNKSGLFSKLNNYFRRYKNTYNHISDENPDVIFIHGCQFLDIIYAKKYYLNRLKKNHKIKIYVDNHADYINSAKNWLSKNIQHKIIWRRCAKLIEPYTECFYGVTPLRCNFLSHMYKISENKIKLLNLGVDTTLLNLSNRDKYKKEFCKEHKISEDSFLIVTGGKINKLKNTHLLLQAVRGIQNENIHLIVFGSISHDIKEQILELLNQSNVHYLNWINLEQAVNIFTISDLAIFPGTHSVYWEQVVGCELPAVFKYWEGMEHVDTGGNCIFLKNDSVLEIKETIEKIVNDEKVYNDMLVAAKEGAKIFSYYEIASKSLEC